MTRVLIYINGKTSNIVEHKFESDDAARVALMEIGFEYSESSGTWTCYKGPKPFHFAVTQQYNPLAALIANARD